MAVADFGHTRFFAYRSARRMFGGYQTGIGSQMGSLSKTGDIYLGQKTASGKTTDTWNREKQLNLLGFVRVVGKKLVQFFFQDFDFFVQKADSFFRLNDVAVAKSVRNSVGCAYADGLP